MAGTVKIKKSKNLRFRLISVLYLLFISLSILQIPIEWFRINYSLLDYMNKSTKVELTVPEIKSCYDYIEDLDKRYLEALGGYDPATGKGAKYDGVTGEATPEWQKELDRQEAARLEKVVRLPL